MKKVFLISVLVFALGSCGLQEEKPTDIHSWAVEKVSSWVMDQKETWKENTNSWKTEKDGEIYDISKINIWEDIYWLKLKDKKITENKDMAFSLVWEKEVSWKLSWLYDEMSEKNVFYFTSDETKTLIIPYPTNKDKEILFSTQIANTWILDENLQKILLSWKKIEAKWIITKYDYLWYNLSEKFVSMEVKNLQLLEEISKQEVSEEEKLLKGFAKDIFMKEDTIKEATFVWNDGRREQKIKGFMLRNANYSDSDIWYEWTLFDSWEMDKNNIWDSMEESFVWFKKGNMVCRVTTKVNATEEQILKDWDPSLYWMTLTIACWKYNAQKNKE